MTSPCPYLRVVIKRPASLTDLDLSLHAALVLLSGITLRGLVSSERLQELLLQLCSLGLTNMDIGRVCLSEVGKLNV